MCYSPSEKKKKKKKKKKQVSRGPLHKAAISGQYETVKMLLEGGEDVDQRDQVLFQSFLISGRLDRLKG